VITTCHTYCNQVKHQQETRDELCHDKPHFKTSCAPVRYHCCCFAVRALLSPHSAVGSAAVQNTQLTLLLLVGAA
jgi:hypothetical protein